ncbi:peptidase M28 [Pseudopedobacter saltans DSM 12145]|uniref:Peptidase M28 n=1 Tax=Pseudopedobacter saltans (strain ATCC 51119 / DSM 12145 / JCM 21818 / CCUG 39354 / LMG 10337 / NBRC 100064 / NCIMB 13643) TaxID=762903 RepID=F0SAN8_PSESL|nr:M20/M25/M40 family metallo-hydrolase [Pseudopedobacter saltans]ADY53659.1 peptidase M28 [Pseudopedobacter saltans DSM 12145]
MKNKIYTIFTLILLSAILSCKGQSSEPIVDIKETQRILKTLASDDMRGRNVLVPEDINRAAMFIAKEFAKIGLKGFEGDTSYYQEFEKRYKGRRLNLKNVIGVLPGKKRPNEFVVFSAHYDHIGILPAIGQDSIANGADDNASGVSAMIQLAKIFKNQNANERTLLFVAFTGEEVGFWGSEYFSDKVNAKNIVAMLNLEMIGKESKFGKNTAYITGFRFSDLGKIMQNHLKNTKFMLYEDPYTTQQLFYRSDNMPLVKKGIPAHTLSTVQINKDETYHTVKDEVEQLDVDNIAGVIKMVAIGMSGIVSGEETPTRIKANRR